MPDKMIQPSSPFPFSPLTDDEAWKRRDGVLAVIGLNLIDRKRITAADAHAYADHLRGSDVRCGHKRKGWNA